jgi:uroporphyrinogen decarboxylase
VLEFLTQGALIEEDVRAALGVDCAPAAMEPEDWQVGALCDGTPAEFPAKLRLLSLRDRSRVVLDEAGRVVAKMPRGGHFYDPVYPALADAVTVADVDKQVEVLATYDAPAYLDKAYAVRAAEIRERRRSSDAAYVGFFGGHLLQAGQVLRGWEAFLMDLLVNRKLAHAILDRLLQAHLARFDRFAATVGREVDVILFEEDLGMQDRSMMAPSTFRQMIKPYMGQLLTHARDRCDALILLHTDGAVRDLIPDLIEMGVDAINPVQVSAKGMDARALKREFGRDIAFWGGGCDSQWTLPHGSPQDVEDEVRRHIDALAPGGGYVFAPIHNILPDVPLDNVMALFRAARAYGTYP